MASVLLFSFLPLLFSLSNSALGASHPKPALLSAPIPALAHATPPAPALVPELVQAPSPALAQATPPAPALVPELTQVPVPAPALTPDEAPTLDCSAYADGTLSCLDFIQEGSNVAKPDSSCCTTLQKIIGEKVACLCAILTANENDLGMQINVSRVLVLPHDCKFSLPTSSQCQSLLGPAVAPSASEPSASKGSAADASSPPLPSKSFAVALPLTVFAVAAGIAVSMLSLIA